jgi:hypothetical protein
LVCAVQARDAAVAWVGSRIYGDFRRQFECS